MLDRRLGRRRGADARGGRAPDVDWRIEERPHRHAALARVKKTREMAAMEHDAEAHEAMLEEKGASTLPDGSLLHHIAGSKLADLPRVAVPGRFPAWR